MPRRRRSTHLVEIITDVVPDLVAANLPDAGIERRRSNSAACAAYRECPERYPRPEWVRTSIPSWLAASARPAAQFVRQGKGSHEIWFSPITNRTLQSCPRNTVKVHTANGVLKDAGLPKAF